MKSLLDLLQEEANIIAKYEQQLRNADYMATEKAHLNPNSSSDIVREDYEHYATKEKEYRKNASMYEKEISRVRREILGYLTKMIEDETPKKKTFFDCFLKK